MWDLIGPPKDALAITSAMLEATAATLKTTIVPYTTINGQRI